jgi:hypothetical protein
MTCEDFATVELGWSAALGYWLVNDRPSRLDTDGDGYPCEHTEFPLDLPACCGEEPPDSWVPADNYPWEYFPHPFWERGWYCRDLAFEYDFGDYQDAILYWLWEGEPDRMDADGDGYPCETVWPEMFIRDMLEDPNLITIYTPDMLNEDLPKGMFCRELIWWRPWYRQALAYFFSEGFPARMDADGNGAPCETVYEEVAGWADRMRENPDRPPGLTCEQLADAYGEGSYFGVAGYWLAYDRPADLDPDGDGYPCSPGWPWPDDVEYFKDGSPGCCAG